MTKPEHWCPPWDPCNPPCVLEKARASRPDTLAQIEELMRLASRLYGTARVQRAGLADGSGEIDTLIEAMRELLTQIQSAR